MFGLRRYRWQFPKSSRRGAAGRRAWFIEGASQILSDLSATQWRQMVAHGASRGEEGIKKTSRGAAKELRQSIFFRPSGAWRFPNRVPTAHAMGYLLTLLRSYFRHFCGAQILRCALRVV